MWAVVMEDSIRQPYGEIYDHTPRSDSAEHDLELPGEGVANGVRDGKRRREERGRITGGRRDPRGAGIVPHVAGGKLRGGSLEQDGAGAPVRGCGGGGGGAAAALRRGGVVVCGGGGGWVGRCVG